MRPGQPTLHLRPRLHQPRIRPSRDRQRALRILRMPETHNQEKSVNIIEGIKARLKRCEHLYVRCVHGDEINHRNGARVACKECGESLHRGAMPEFCSYTGEPHWA